MPNLLFVHFTIITRCGERHFVFALSVMKPRVIEAASSDATCHICCHLFLRTLMSGAIFFFVFSKATCHCGCALSDVRCHWGRHLVFLRTLKPRVIVAALSKVMCHIGRHLVFFAYSKVTCHCGRHLVCLQTLKPHVFKAAIYTAVVWGWYLGSNRVAVTCTRGRHLVLEDFSFTWRWLDLLELDSRWRCGPMKKTLHF